LLIIRCVEHFVIVGTQTHSPTLLADRITSKCRRTMMGCASQWLVYSGPGANHIIGHDNTSLALNPLKEFADAMTCCV